MAAILQESNYNLNTGDVTATIAIQVQEQVFNVYCVVSATELLNAAVADGRPDWSMLDLAFLSSDLLGQAVSIP